jgi:mannosyltransferase
MTGSWFRARLPARLAASTRLTAPARDWLGWAGLALPMLLLGLLALRDLGTPSFWRDEVSTVIFARGSLGDLLTIVGRDRQEVGLANMATYYLILHFWLVIGETEARVRLLSVLIGVASVVPVFFVARRLGGWLAAGLAAGIFVLVPYVIHYSQEARGYSLAMLVGGGLTWLVLVGVERRDRIWPWLAYGVVAALGLYVHFFVALVVAAHGLWVLAARRVPAWPAALAAVVPIAIAAAPIPLIMAEFGAEHGWIPPLTARRAQLAITELLGGPLPALAFPVLLLVGAVARRRDSRYWLVAASAVVPVAVALAMSAVKPMFIPRYLIMILPQLAVVAGVALVAVRPNVVRAGLAGALLAVLLIGLPSAYFSATTIPWRSAGRWLADRVQPGDYIVMESWHNSPLDYYFRRADPPTDLVRLRYDTALLGGVEGRVWLALAGMRPREIDDAVAEFLSNYRIDAARSFGPRARIVLLVASDAAASNTR